jgi:peptidoglycan/LPS O-acetylase OafA/YrhL
LVAEFEKAGQISLPQFYARRVRRLLPASALTLVVTLSIGALILAPQELTLAGRAARATALYLSNVFFAINSADYFAPDVKSNPLIHTWSLAVEEQFYVFWPFLILLSLQLLKSRKALLVVLSAVTIVSLGASVWFTAKAPGFSFYQLPTRAWEFGVGGLAVLHPRHTNLMPSGCWVGLGYLGILSILGSGYAISGETNFPGLIAAVPVIGTAAALLAGAELPNRGISTVLNSAPLQAVGTLSYSWYLWHWPLLVFSMALFPDLSVYGKTTVAAAALGVAAVSHRCVENPIRFHPYLSRRPALCLYFAGAVTLVSLGAATLSMRFANQLANTPEMKMISAAADDTGSMPRQRCVSPAESGTVKTCVFGQNSSTTNIVLFGDSHAIQWFNPLSRLAELHAWKLTTVVKSACPATDIRLPGRNAEFTRTCASWRAQAIREIISLHPAVVFIANATGFLGQKDHRPDRLASSLDDLRIGTRRTLESLTVADLKVIIVRDNPFFPFDIPGCLARSTRHSWYPGGSCELKKSQVLNSAVFSAEQSGASGLQNVYFLDLTDELCRGEVCSTVQKGEVMYRDNNHLTGSFADRLMPLLEAKLLLVLSGSGSDAAP